MPKILKFTAMLFLSTLAASSGFGATIKSINAAKKSLTIDEGTDTGFHKKAKVCFYDGTSKLGCGTVRSAKASTATIKVTAKVLAKLKEGLETRLEVVGISTTVKSPADASTAKAASAPSYVKFIYGMIPIVGSVTHANLVYETPQGATAESMWTKDGDPVRAGGIALEYGLGLSSYNLAVGVRLRPAAFYSSKKIASDYDDADADSEGYFEQYAETSTLGSNAFGAYLDFYYLNYNFGVAGIHIGNGIDFDSSVVKFKMTKKDEFNPDLTEVLYQATSKLTAISLRTNLLIGLTFANFGVLQFGTMIALPVSQASKFKMEIDEDPFASKLDGKTAEEDLKKSLDHKASFGVDLVVDFHYNF